MTHHEHTKIRDVMTRQPMWVEPSATIEEVARKLRSEDVGSLPVVENGSLTGMLTDRDIALRVVAAGKSPSSTTAGEIASRDVISIDPDQTLDEAMRLMAQHQVRRLPVCEEDGTLVGIVAQADIALEADEQSTGQVVEEISRK